MTDKISVDIQLLKDCRRVLNCNGPLIYWKDFIKSATERIDAAIAQSPTETVAQHASTAIPRDCAFDKGVVQGGSAVAAAPYANCAYTHCDLPGQCIGEGKCHHPKLAALDQPSVSADDKPTYLGETKDEFIASALDPAMLDTPNCPAHFGMDEIKCIEGCEGDICIRATPAKVNKLLAAARLENEQNKLDRRIAILERDDARRELAKLRAFVSEAEGELPNVDMSQRLTYNTEQWVRLTAYDALRQSAIAKLAASKQTIAEREAEIQRLKDASEMLWIVIANVNGSDWGKQSQEWQDAAVRWRDNYFSVLKDGRNTAKEQPI